ncbi:MAG: NADH-quinone oxidoreductase subunit M [Bacteroidia bacterium]|nr:NADH-quinone oxidoreductase subunit M [Bacteroidia bacterium]MCX7763285.1 NADH-quinone oxidoreductase subunit M [Bacteroidia bacterium]MDW8058171.1 NADH-quinone oxidoreductase subunit M [Bacteroidia bacterium]
MAALILNLLWLSPVAAAGIAFTLTRRGLLTFTIGHGLFQLLLWVKLYLQREAALQIPWSSLAGKTFHYALAAQPSNLALLLLTIIVGHLALYYGQREVGRVRSFSALFWLALGFSQGVFLAKDVLLFFVFYEAALVPAFLLIYGWGGIRRKEAAVKFALFTLGGSVLFLVGMILALNSLPDSTYEAWASGGVSLAAWGLMTVGLAVKLPLFPLHSWLGEAHVEAATAVSMLLAGILLKLGGYALLQWVWFSLSSDLAWLLRIWGGVSLAYAAAVATGQIDLKRLIAFTSIAHMALVAVGAGAQDERGLQGAYHQLFTHGLISAGLFAWVGMVEKVLGSRRITELRGSLARQPFQAAILFFGAIGIPGSALFVSEMMIVWGVAAGSGWSWALIPASGVVLSAIYFLRTYRELAAPTEKVFPPTLSLPPYQKLVWLLILLSVGVGIYPKLWLDLLAHVGR